MTKEAMVILLLSITNALRHTLSQTPLPPGYPETLSLLSHHYLCEMFFLFDSWELLPQMNENKQNSRKPFQKKTWRNELFWKAHKS